MIDKNQNDSFQKTMNYSDDAAMTLLFFSQQMFYDDANHNNSTPFNYTYTKTVENILI